LIRPHAVFKIIKPIAARNKAWASLRIRSIDYEAIIASAIPLNFYFLCSMILSDKRILEEIEKGSILIEPFRPECLGSNSYDVHLGKYMAVYTNRVLDAKSHNKIEEFIIPPEGMVLYPGILYLGVTEEYTETHKHIPFLEGKSSTGRLGIDIHATAGKGDVGFCNTWTLEISVSMPVRIYASMPIGQLIYFLVDGEVNVIYNKKRDAKYNKRTI
jgi:dCTP deaminase